MQRLILLLMIMLFWLAAPISRTAAQELVFTETPTPDPQAVVITSPTEGQALKGNVSISGRVAVHGFAAYELSFTYSDNPTETWFLIQESSQLVEGDILGQWDTSIITDGVYDLRLVVVRQEGEPLIYTVSKLRVRNYTPVETNTPTPVTPTSTPLPGDTPLPTVTPTPTNTPIPPTMTVLPPNPAQITTQDVGLSVGKGALFSLGLFALIGIYISIKNIRRRL